MGDISCKGPPIRMALYVLPASPLRSECEVTVLHDHLAVGLDHGLEERGRSTHPAPGRPVEDVLL
jgi:hypothetical protein